MLSIFYGLLSALTWGAGDFAGGLAARKLGAYRAVFYGDALGLLALLIVTAFIGEEIPNARTLLLSGVAGMLGSVGLLTLYYSMARGQMSIAAPVSALFAAALPVIVGALIQGLPTLIQFVGFALALIAIWLISQGDSAHRFHIDKLSDLRLPLLAGLGFGSYFVFMHYALSGVSSTYWPMIASRTAGTLMVCAFVLARRESFVVQRAAWGIVLVNAILDVGGNLFYILALKSGRLDIAAVLSSLYPGATVILAWLILKERISRPQVIGILLALGAIALFAI